MGKGRVIGIDIEIRSHNRKAIEQHELFPYITLIEGSSTDPTVVKEARSKIGAGEKVMVILDSNHSKQHVLDELEAYCDLVTPGSYIVATDGSMQDLHDVPRGRPDWTWNNPTKAAEEFLRTHREFVLEQPTWLFNESGLTDNITHWPGAWLFRK
jgi:cephalosporin hydroxylase